MTDIKKYLYKTGKPELLEIAKKSITDPDLFNQLVECALSDIQPESKRAVWTLDMVFDFNQNVIIPYLPRILKRLPEFKEERNQGSFLHMFSRMHFDLETDNLGILFDFCLSVLRAEKVQMYMKYYSMLVLENMGRQIPDLISEICIEINENIDTFDRDHLKHTGRKIISTLEKIQTDLSKTTF